MRKVHGKEVEMKFMFLSHMCVFKCKGTKEIKQNIIRNPEIKIILYFLVFTLRLFTNNRSLIF